MSRARGHHTRVLERVRGRAWPLAPRRVARETTMTSPNTNVDLNFILQQHLANQILNGHAYVEP